MESNVRPKKSFPKKIFFGILSITVVGLSIGYWVVRDLPRFKYADTTVSLGGYFDWTTATGKLADEIRSQVTAPIITVGENNRRFFGLATSVSYDESAKSATVDLRGEAYWSDGALLESQQVVDAWERCVRLFSEGTWRPTEEESIWMRKYSFKNTGRSQFRVDGVTSEVELNTLLSSKMALPIRSDLLAATGKKDWKSVTPEEAAAAWKVTLGSYKVADFAPTPTPALSTIKLIPNETSYRGPAPNDLVLDVYKFL